jgi:excisionase family DNA binding protein
MPDRLLTSRDVAEYVVAHPETVLRWVRRGEIPALRLPSGELRFREAEIDAWLEERATTVRGEVTHPASRRPAGKASDSHPPQ